MSLDPLRDRFDGVDSDGNGRIDEAEFSLLLGALGVGYGDAQVHAAFTSTRMPTARSSSMSFARGGPIAERAVGESAYLLAGLAVPGPELPVT